MWIILVPAEVSRLGLARLCSRIFDVSRTNGAVFALREIKRLPKPKPNQRISNGKIGGLVFASTIMLVRTRAGNYRNTRSARLHRRQSRR